MEYIILSGYPAADLAKNVNKYLKEGWSLYEAPYHNPNNGYHYQAMVKENIKIL